MADTRGRMVTPPIALRKSIRFFFIPALFAIYLVFCFHIHRPLLSIAPAALLLCIVAFRLWGIVASLFSFFLATVPLHYYNVFPSAYFYPLEACIIAGAILFPLFMRNDISGFLRFLPYKGSIALIAFSILISGLFLLNSSNSFPSLALYGTIKVVLFLLGYFIVCYLLYYNHVSIHHVFLCLTTAGLLLLAAALGDYLMRGQFDLIFKERFGSSTPVNANSVGLILDMIFPIALFSALYSKNSVIQRSFFSISASLFFIALILTKSRGSYFGLLAIAAFFLLRRLTPIKGIVAAVIIVFSFSFLYYGFLYRFDSNDKLSAMISNFGRIEMLKAAAAAIQDNHYFFGNGMLTFSKMKYDYNFPLWFDTKMIMSSHNYFLEFFLGLGLFGFLGIVVFSAGPIVSLLQSKPAKEEKYIRLGLLFSLISFFLHGLVDCQIGHISFSTVLFSITASAVFFIRQNRERHKYHEHSFPLQ